MGVADRLLDGVAHVELRLPLAQQVPGRGVDDGELGPPRPQPPGDVQGRRVAEVVGVGLERDAQHRHLLAGQPPAHGLLRERDRMIAAAPVDGVHLAQEREGLVDAQLPGPGHERPDVLGEAAAAEPDAGLEELLPDPVVVADGLGQPGHVPAGRVTQLGHRVDERDLRGEERVGGHLHQLGRRVVRHHQRGALAQRDGVALVEDLLRDGAAGEVVRQPVDQAVRVEGVGHRVALAEKLGVPRQEQVLARGRQRLLDLLRGADGDGRLARHQHRPATRGHLGVLDNGRDGGPHVGHVRAQPAFELRRADADEVDLRVAGVGGIGGEAEPPGPDVAGKEGGEVRLVERGLPLRQQRHLGLVDVQTHDVVAELGHACRVHGPEVAASDHRDSHGP